MKHLENKWAEKHGIVVGAVAILPVYINIIDIKINAGAGLRYIIYIGFRRSPSNEYFISLSVENYKSIIGSTRLDRRAWLITVCGSRASCYADRADRAKIRILTL